MRLHSACRTIVAAMIVFSLACSNGCGRRDRDDSAYLRDNSAQSGTSSSVAEQAGELDSDKLAVIEEVDLRDGEITAERLDALAGNEALRRLTLAGSDIDDAGIDRLADLPRLTVLDLTGCESLTPTALDAIGRMRGLRNLRLSGPVVDDRTVTNLAGLSELAALLLRETALTDAGAAKLTSLSKLKELNLFGTPVSDASLESLAKLPRLEKLGLRGTAVTGRDVTALATMQNVVELDLSETGFDNAGMADVAAMPALQRLNLWLTRVDDSGVARLRDHAALTSLNLDNVSGITDESLPVIESLRSLTFLHLGGTSVTPAGLSRWAPPQQLETLILTRLGLPVEQAAALRQRLPGLDRLDY